ncbi:uncharacterized protein, partial [Setaria viridis]|uniref:uncharacterized protein n=1 Tax=Setaria viridis TaxID=4556 RepID=UPI0014939F01
SAKHRRPSIHRSRGGSGCTLGLSRLVRRLRRQGRRALRSAASAASSQQRCRECQYDPLSYARKFNLGGCNGDAYDAAQVYYGCFFSSHFVLVPAASQSAGAVSAGAAQAAVTTASKYRMDVN